MSTVTIVGSYLINSSGNYTAFSYENKKFTDVGPTFCMYYNAAAGINDKGEIAGTYEHQAIYAKGFSRAADGTIATFALRGGSTYPWAFAVSINDNGVIAGWYQDKNGAARGYLQSQ